MVRSLAIAAVLLLPLFTLASAAVKIRMARRGQPFSRRLQPLHFWADVSVTLLFAAALLGLLHLTDMPGPNLNMMMVTVLLATNAGLLVEASPRSQHPSKYEFASAREYGEDSATLSIVLWCLAALATVFGYYSILSDLT